jgi:muramoyltetrapeptide carboxypeptidase
MDEGAAERVAALAVSRHGDRVEIVFHPQCFLREGHFAGSDAARAAALVEVANDPAFSAVWFARGGYGSYRIIDQVLADFGPAARGKLFLGYSDLGSLLGAFYRHQIGHVAHGPMPADITRAGGDVAVARAIDFLVVRDRQACAGGPGLGAKRVAFNLTILTRLIGTPHFPDLEGHVLLLEEVSEYMYNIDRMMGHLMAYAPARRVAGVALGRCSLIPPNDPDFGQTEEQVVAHWCARAGVAYLGRADIGHDIDNKVVPFGSWLDLPAPVSS